MHFVNRWSNDIQFIEWIQTSTLSNLRIIQGLESSRDNAFASILKIENELPPILSAEKSRPSVKK